MDEDAAPRKIRQRTPRLLTHKDADQYRAAGDEAIDGAIELGYILVVEETPEAKDNPLHVTRPTFDKYARNDPVNAERLVNEGYLVVDNKKAYTTRPKSPREIKNGKMPETWLDDVPRLSPEDRSLGERLEAGENVEYKIRASEKNDWKVGLRYAIDPWPLRDLMDDPDAYQKMMNDIDTAIRKNIREWANTRQATTPRVRSRKVVLGGFPSRQCSACLRLNPPYADYCCFCGGRFR